MKIEVLYVAECPSHPAAVKLIKDVLGEVGASVRVSEVLVTDDAKARELGFIGSPTVRVNGRDIAGDARKEETFGLSCRVCSGSKQIGLPPVELVRRAILEALERDQR